MNTPWLRRVALISVTALLAVACGGGVGTGGTGSFASGPITGFGSVIVNDIVFDDAAASVEDGDGAARGRTDLRLGMTVEVESDAIAGGAARASRVRYDSALVGPVSAVDRNAGTFVLLGQTVAVDDTTVFDERLIGRLALLVPGGWAEVYALYDPALQRFRATRVEARLVQPLVYRVRGVVQQLDKGASTLRIGGATFHYGSALNVPADLADGQFVRIAVSTAPPAGGRYQVAAFGAALRALPELDLVVVKGLVNRLDSVSSFQVDGRPVDAAAARFDGTPALGLRVEVEGAMRSGVLRAAAVRVRSDDQERERGFDLRGSIESVSATQPRTFVLRGLTIGTSHPQLRYDNGTAADLAVGRAVEVRGMLSAGGTGIDATRIKFE